MLRKIYQTQNMTKEEANSQEILDIVEKYCQLSWAIVQGSWQDGDGTNNYFYTFQSSRMVEALRFDKVFDEHEMLTLEGEKVARQNHTTQIDIALAFTKADIIRQLGILYRKDVEIPIELTVGNIVIDLKKKYEV